MNWIPVHKREQGAVYNRSIVTKDKREAEERAHGVFPGGQKYGDRQNAERWTKKKQVRGQAERDAGHCL